MRGPALALAAAALLLPALAGAGEVNGHLSSRSQYTHVRPQGLLPADDVARFSELLELNGQVRQHYTERSFVYGDVSVFAQVAGGYRGLNDEGEVVSLEDHDAAASRPFISLNELYLNHEFLPSLVVTAGKKRIVWGSGMAVNPTDLLNPQKDPTDPSLQRAGAWLAQLEVPLESVTFSLVASPQVTAQNHGVPYRFLYYPPWNELDDQAHWLLAARVYALVADSDLNLMAFYGNRYPDAFEDKLRLGASFSRNFWDVNELHLEALLQRGSPIQRFDPDCVADRAAAMRCAFSQTPFTTDAGLTDPTFRPRLLAGVRRVFGDDSMVSLEYLYQADGYSPEELQHLVNALSLQRSLRGAAAGGAFGGEEVETGIPSRFRFQPLGRHYLFATWQKPQIRDDFTAQLTVIASLQDLSTLLAPMLSWSATEWLTLTASGFIPLDGPRRFAATDPEDDTPVSEYSLPPMAWRGILEARLFY